MRTKSGFCDSSSPRTSSSSSSRTTAALRVLSLNRRRRRISNSRNNGFSDERNGFDEKMNKSIAGDDDTIVAIATPVVPQQGGVAIVRISGSKAFAIAKVLFKKSGSTDHEKKKRKKKTDDDCDDGTNNDDDINNDEFESHRIMHGTINERLNERAIIDEVLLLPFKKPRSYTAEDVVEIHTHGGSICSQRVLNECLRTNMCRLAQNGEFTMRAFLNGRLDLSQAEAVYSLIKAETNEAAVQALKTLRGGLSQDVKIARAKMIDVLAELEARLDFDDEMIPLDSNKIAKEVDEARKVAINALSTSQKNASLSAGCTLAIVGRPNAGKSRLLNRWTNSERSIVTDVEGTTRDVVEAQVNVAGVKITLLDTAGIRENEEEEEEEQTATENNQTRTRTKIDKVQAVGIERSKVAARGADLCAFVLDASRGWERADEIVWREALDVAKNVIFVANKMDELLPLKISSVEDLNNDKIGKMKPFLENTLKVPKYVLDKCTLDNVVFASAKDGFGIDCLEEKVSKLFESGFTSVEGEAYFVSTRQSEALKTAIEAMERVKESALNDLPVDFWTIDLREAAVALGEVTGEDVSEDILGTIFERFCIGK